jgi:hypothetical protein
MYQLMTRSGNQSYAEANDVFAKAKELGFTVGYHLLAVYVTCNLSPPLPICFKPQDIIIRILSAHIPLSSG